MTIVPRNGIPGKVCVICDDWKPLEQFKRNGRSSDKHDHKCRSCRGYRQIKHSVVNGVEGKVCTDCKEWHPLSLFNVEKQHSDGLASYCRNCTTRRTKEQWSKDPAFWNERNKASYQKHRPTRLASAHRYRDENYETVLEKGRVRGRKYRKNNPGYWKKRDANRKERLANTETPFTAIEWAALCEQYKHTCLRCGKSVPEIELTIDHIKPLSRGGTNDISNIQPLCLKCNLRKATKTIDYRPQKQ